MSPGVVERRLPAQVGEGDISTYCTACRLGELLQEAHWFVLQVVHSACRMRGPTQPQLSMAPDSGFEWLRAPLSSVRRLTWVVLSVTAEVPHAGCYYAAKGHMGYGIATHAHKKSVSSETKHGSLPENSSSRLQASHCRPSFGLRPRFVGFCTLRRSTAARGIFSSDVSMPCQVRPKLSSRYASVCSA